MEKKLKLFVWEGVLCDWTCGMICILAEDLKQARELLLKKDKNAWGQVKFKAPKVITKPKVFTVHGGG